jgi:hypothetical protein
LRVRAESAGKPIADAAVTLVYGQPGLDNNFQWGSDDVSWLDVIRGRTDAAGVAEFPKLQFDEATVLVRAPGFARRRLGWRDGRGEVKLELAPEAVLSGEVIDAAGIPIKNCYVNVFTGGDHVSATVGPVDGGRFRIGELPAGDWAITVRAADGITILHGGHVALKAGEKKEMPIATTKR